MSLSSRILLILSVFLLCFAPVAFAEPADAATEIVTEATYQMGEADTPAKAEEQALLRAKRNAIEQASPLAVTMEKIAALPADVLEVTVLDKKRTLNGDKMVFWVQIRAVVHTDKLEAAVKNGSFPDEYYCEMVTYIKGDKNVSQSRMWISKKGNRSEVVDGGRVLGTINRDDTKVMWYLCNNKYFEVSTANQVFETPLAKEETLGTEVIGGITAQKKQTTQTYKNGAVYKTVSWIDPATNFPLRNEISSSVSTYVTVCEYRNLRIGPQNPALFELPAGYAKCASFEQLYGDSSVAATGQADPLQNALDGAAQTVINNAINSIFSF